MQYLTQGTYQFRVPALYDRLTRSCAAPALHVARLLPAPLPRAVEEEIAYQSLEDCQPGAARFLDSLEPSVLRQSRSFLEFQRHIAGLGLDQTSIADVQLLYCDTASFHDDAAFNTIFAAMHLAGAPGDVVFPRLGARVHMTPGSLVLFDCREPHAFLPKGCLQWQAPDAQGGCPARGQTQLLSVDFDPLHREVRRCFGLCSDVRFDPRHHFDMTHRTVCPTTGRHL